MADITAGLGNLNNQVLNNYNNNMNIGSFNNINDYTNITRLDDFFSQGGNEESELLKGAVTKIQEGTPLDASDMEGLSNENSQLIKDLQSLVEKPIHEISSREGIHGPQQVADEFSNMLDKYINNVNGKHKNAAQAVETFASGGDIDIHSVMIASEKASLSMQLAMQLKSKLLTAYKEVSSMRV